MPLLDRFLHNLTASPDEIRAENLRRWARSIPETKPISALEHRERAKVAGVIQNIRIDPRDGGSIEATISDGSGQMVAKWLGRASLSGIRLGEGLVLEGAIGRTDEGQALVLNPEYDLIPGPEHG